MNKFKSWIIKKLGGYTDLPPLREVKPFIMEQVVNPVTLSATFKSRENFDKPDDIALIRRYLCEKIADKMYEFELYNLETRFVPETRETFYIITAEIIKREK